MNGCGHKIVRCSSCGRIVMQCRCPDQNKHVEYVGACPKCPPTQVRLEELPKHLQEFVKEKSPAPEPSKEPGTTSTPPVSDE